LAPVSDQLFCDRPGPDDPGGLGAEESGIERTGPTQANLIAIQQGTRWAEVGPYYDWTNDPVTRRNRPVRLENRAPELAEEAGCGNTALAERFGRRNHVSGG